MGGSPRRQRLAHQALQTDLHGGVRRIHPDQRGFGQSDLQRSLVFGIQIARTTQGVIEVLYRQTHVSPQTLDHGGAGGGCDIASDPQQLRAGRDIDAQAQHGTEQQAHQRAAHHLAETFS